MSVGLANDEVKNFLCKGDNNTTGESEEALTALRGIVGLETEADLYDTPTEQNEADSTDQSEDKGGQIVHDGQRIITGSKCGEGKATHQRDRQNCGRIAPKALFDLRFGGEGRMIGVLLHVFFPPISEVFLRVLHL